MNLLITGAFSASEEQLNKLRSLGYSLFFQKDERGEPECDFSNIDAVVCNNIFTYHDIDKFKSLKIIQLTSAGLDRVPVEKIEKRKIVLFNARGVYSIPMAEFAVAGILNCYKHFCSFYVNQQNSDWKKDRELKELSGSTVSIVGCGSVGTECAKRLSAFGTEIFAVDVVKPENEVYNKYFEICNIKSAVSKSDIVILTLPLTPQTKGMFNKDLFSHFKKDCLFVNISRGAVVNENDLICALKEKKVGTAILDVFNCEPLPKESELWDLENVLITPHNSFVSENNNVRLFNLIFNNLKKLMKGDF